MLAAYRKVSRKESAYDRTPLEKAARQLMESDPKAFFAQFERLEREHRDQGDLPQGDHNLGDRYVDGVGVATENEDFGTARCIELCEWLLKQWAAEDAANH